MIAEDYPYEVIISPEDVKNLGGLWRPLYRLEPIIVEDWLIEKGLVRNEDYYVRVHYGLEYGELTYLFRDHRHAIHFKLRWS